MKNLNDVVDELLKDVREQNQQFGPMAVKKQRQLQQIEEENEFKVPVARKRRIERRGVEINDLVYMLQADQRVKAFNRECISANPDLLEKATVQHMETHELKRAIDL